MAIVFHCKFCTKKIEAKDAAGGKWGKCPSCQNKIYIPGLNVKGDDLILAPIDEQDSARQKQLMAETYKIEQDIFRVREESGESSDIPAAMGGEMSEKELVKQVVSYLRNTADGELAEAEKAVRLLANHGPKAVEILDRIAVSEVPEPELADIPGQVLSGFIRELRGKIS